MNRARSESNTLATKLVWRIVDEHGTMHCVIAAYTKCGWLYYEILTRELYKSTCLRHPASEDEVRL